MYSGLLIVIVATYYLVQIAKRDHKLAFAERAYRKQLNSAPTIPIEPEKRLEYIVNSKKIPCAFERYYYVKLKMPLPVMKIEPDIIERHYQQRLQDNELDINILNDVEAANRFFIDRIEYLSYLN